MLTFVGLGLYDEHSITLEGKHAIQDADHVFAEFYTSILPGVSISALEAFHGVEFEVRDREGIEQHPDSILDAAVDGNVVFLTAGDTMISTTHVDLRLRAHDRGISTRVVHAPSAHSAASGLTGLQNYRFGKATTIPFPASHTGDGLPGSVVETIRSNRERALHTLAYLDIRADEDMYMTADRGATLLADAGITGLGVAVCRAGSPEPLVVADTIASLREQRFGDPLHLLVLPASLHELEAEALTAFGNADPALLADQE